MHGHTYNVEVELFGFTDKFTDMLMDFGDIKKVVKGYDHKVLNDVMDCEKATVEKLAEFIFLEIADLAPVGVQSIRVTVDEGGAGEVVACAARTS
jgi:6-pyruvoyl-tetrahydropterin synthase